MLTLQITIVSFISHSVIYQMKSYVLFSHHGKTILDHTETLCVENGFKVAKCWKNAFQFQAQNFAVGL